MLNYTLGERSIWSNIKKSQNIMNMFVGSKFQLKLTVLIFGIKITQKQHLLSKT